VNISVEKLGPKCDQLFVLHSQWIVSGQVTDGVRSRPA
jgi:hypothetical protein